MKKQNVIQKKGTRNLKKMERVGERDLKRQKEEKA